MRVKEFLSVFKYDPACSVNVKLGEQEGWEGRVSQYKGSLSGMPRQYLDYSLLNAEIVVMSEAATLEQYFELRLDLRHQD